MEEEKANVAVMNLDRIQVDELDLAVSNLREHRGSVRQMFVDALGIRLRLNNSDGEYSSYSDEYRDEENEDYEDLLELDEDVVDPVPEELLRQLPTSKFTQANLDNFSEENKSCSICQENYKVNEKYIILPCLHRFHVDCVSTWFERKSTCPICKRKVSGENDDEE